MCVGSDIHARAHAERCLISSDIRSTYASSVETTSRSCGSALSMSARISIREHSIGGEVDKAQLVAAEERILSEERRERREIRTPELPDSPPAWWRPVPCRIRSDASISHDRHDDPADRRGTCSKTGFIASQPASVCTGA